MTIPGTLNENEPHPAAGGARQWLIRYIQRKDAYALLRLQESFASCGIEGNRLAELCSETLRRLLAKEPVSDRYLLGLVWTIRDMEEQEKAESGLVKELADSLTEIVGCFDAASFEGLQDRLDEANIHDLGSLADLVHRRLLCALPVAQQALAKAKPAAEAV